jgi:hypothetical protein
MTNHDQVIMPADDWRDLYNPLIDRLSKQLMFLDLLHMLEVDRRYAECMEEVGDAYICWLRVGAPLRLTPPRPPRPDVLEAASYAGILKDMRANVLETVDIIDGLMEKEPPF